MFALVVVASLAACGGSDGDQTSGPGSGLVSKLHDEAVEKGYDGQAALLRDGQVSYADLRLADQAMIACADREGVALKAFEFETMFGKREMVEPLNTSGAVDAAFVNGVIERCQTSEQGLVEQGYAEANSDLTDAAYRLWQECATSNGYSGTLPRHYAQITTTLDGDLFVTCEIQVAGQVETSTG